MPAELEACVRHLLGQGKDKDSAYAICTTAMQKAGKMASQEEVHRLAEEEAKVSKHALPDTYSLNGIEVFAAGQWNDDIYTVNDIDDIVTAFHATKELSKPYIKLGHSDRQTLLSSDELPAAGWITNAYRRGEKLLIDVVGIPRKIYELIKAGGYKRVSSELYINSKWGGRLWPKLLKAVAFLGGETPAVNTLEDIHALYSDAETAKAYSVQKSEWQVKTYQFTKNEQEEQDMTLEEAQKALGKAEGDRDAALKKLAEAEAKVKSLESDKKALENSKAESDKRVMDSEAKLASFEAKAKKDRIESKVSKAIEDRKILPAQKDLFVTLFSNLPETKERKFSVGDKEYADLESVMDAVIGSNAEVGPPTKEKLDGHKADGSLVEQAKKYSEQHKVSFSEALKAVAPKDYVPGR